MVSTTRRPRTCCKELQIFRVVRGPSILSRFQQTMSRFPVLGKGYAGGWSWSTSGRMKWLTR